MSGEVLSSRAPRTDALASMVLAVAVRLGVVAWAGGGAMAGDAQFYRVLAARIAEGHGYTWAWPDGAVTSVAHYPVGWPAALALFDRSVGWLLGGAPGDLLRHPWAAQAFAATLSAAAAPLVWALVARDVPGRRVPGLAALLVALHPGLVLYAPALMSEGPTATALVAAALLSALARDALGVRRWAWLTALGVLLGVATLLRPQSILFAPVFGALAAVCASPAEARPRLLARRTAGAAVLVATVALATVAPWTLRNCREMGRCALVSVNGGWNLLIGADPAGSGAWAEVQVPPPCRQVWDEAEKDVCFGDAARSRIAADPVGFLALAPRKLAATFDYGGAGPWWLSASRPEVVGPRAKLVSGALETVFQRVLMVLSAVAVARAGPRGVVGRLAVVVSVVMALQLHAWVAYLALAVALASLGLRRRPLVLPATAAAILLTAAVHAVFFGAGRYQVLVLPLIAAVAAMALPAREAEPRAAAI